MNGGARLAGFAMTLLLALGAGFGVGRAVGPLDVGGSRPDTVGPGTSVPGPGGQGGEHGDGNSGTGHDPAPGGAG